MAEYRFEKEFGPTHAKMFTVRLYLGAKEYVGTERTMTLAQCAAAQLALEDHQGCAFGKHYNAAEASSPIPGNGEDMKLTQQIRRDEDGQ